MLGMECLVIVGFIKKVCIFPQASPIGEKRKKVGDTVYGITCYTLYGIMSVLLWLLVLGFLIVFREFGMISE